MKRALCLLLALTLLVPFSPTPAHAGCCDDFWGCLGAVVTGGLSCAVQEAVEAISNFVKLVRDVRDKGKAEMQAAFNQHKAAAQQAAQDARDEMNQMLAAMEQAKKDAEKANRDMQTIKAVIPLGGAPTALQKSGAAAGAAASAGAAAGAAAKGGATGAAASKGAMGASAGAAAAGAAAGTPQVTGAARDSLGGAGGAVALAVKLGDPSQISAAMKEGEKQVAAERDKLKNQKMQAMEQMAKQTESAATNRVNALMTLLDVVFVAPLASILALFAVGDPVALAVTIAVVTPQLNAIKASLDNKMDPEIAKASDEQAKMIEAMEQKAQEHQKDVDKAAKIAALMQKLEKSRTQGNLEALEHALGIKHTTTLALAGGLETPLMVRKVAFKGAALHVASREQAVSINKRLKTDLDAPIAMAINFKKPVPPPVGPFQARVNTDLENQFRGRTGAALTQRRDDLIAEARTYFARDPKTLEAVEKYLRDHVAARGAR